MNVILERIKEVETLIRSGKVDKSHTFEPNPESLKSWGKIISFSASINCTI